METGPRSEIKTPPSTMMKRLKGAGNDAVDFPLRSFTPLGIPLTRGEENIEGTVNMSTDGVGEAFTVTLREGE